MTLQKILDRLTAIEQLAGDTTARQSGHCDGCDDDDCDGLTVEVTSSVSDALIDAVAALKLDIESHCLRAGVPFA